VIDVLRELTGGDRLHFEMVRELLDIEQRHKVRARRAGLFDELEKALKRGFYDDEADATLRAQTRRDRLRSNVEIDPVDVSDGYMRRSASVEEDLANGAAVDTR
jgi:DNA sulfur modification protein DndC